MGVEVEVGGLKVGVRCLVVVFLVAIHMYIYIYMCIYTLDFMIMAAKAKESMNTKLWVGWGVVGWGGVGWGRVGWVGWGAVGWGQGWEISKDIYGSWLR